MLLHPYPYASLHPILFCFCLYILINKKTYGSQVAKYGQDYDWSYVTLDEAKVVYKARISH